MHKFIPAFVFLWLFALATFVACGGTHGVSDDEYDVFVYGLMTDSRDGQVYKTVKIGSQIWMAENLNYELPESFCHEENPNSCIKYGRLYKWDLQWMRALMAIYNGNGSDDYGFSALPAGTMFIDSYGTRYKSEGFGVYFWSSTRYDKNDAFSMSLHDERDGGNLLGMNKKAGLNVRCVKDY